MIKLPDNKKREKKFIILFSFILTLITAISSSDAAERMSSSSWYVPTSWSSSYKSVYTPYTPGQEKEILTPIERISLEKVPSIFLYALKHGDFKSNPLTSQTQWRLYTAEEQDFDTLPSKAKEGSTFWFSPPDVNIYATFNFQMQTSNASHLSKIAGITVAQVLEELDVPVKLRWPNDVMVNHKKISGIGIELWDLGNIATVFINIGLNVNMSQTMCSQVDHPATSLLVEKGILFDKEKILANLASQLHKNCELVSKEGFSPNLHPYYHKHLEFLGEEVVFDPKEKEEGLVEGIFTGINKSGYAVLLIDNVEKTFMKGSMRRKEDTGTMKNLRHFLLPFFKDIPNLSSILTSLDLHTNVYEEQHVDIVVDQTGKILEKKEYPPQRVEQTRITNSTTPFSPDGDEDPEEDHGEKQQKFKLDKSDISEKWVNDRFGNFYRNKKDNLYYTKEVSGERGHGGCRWKIYQKTGKGLEWEGDLDITGKEMKNKHKSDVGKFIPWKDLRRVF